MLLSSSILFTKQPTPRVLKVPTPRMLKVSFHRDIRDLLQLGIGANHENSLAIELQKVPPILQSITSNLNNK